MIGSGRTSRRNIQDQAVEGKKALILKLDIPQVHKTKCMQTIWLDIIHTEEHGLDSNVFDIIITAGLQRNS